eukprot:jgi/Picsp_1/6106/NSC_03460-R1_---NA---
MQEDLRGEEPTLNAEAGATESAARHAGAHGYADEKLHAGFITKQTGLPPASHEHVEVHHYEGAPPTEHIDIGNHPAELRDPALGSEAGATEKSASAAGRCHGAVDKELHAGFITKQTPIGN